MSPKYFPHLCVILVRCYHNKDTTPKSIEDLIHKLDNQFTRTKETT